MPSQEQIEQALDRVTDPGSGEGLHAARVLRKVEFGGDGKVTLRLVLGYPARSTFDALREAARAAVAALPGVREVTVDLSTRIDAHAVQRGVRPLEGVRN
ncbi:MAG: DUF59 domain-containing protein, partial [Betaproteobacteria bacterium]|nr:DUF59 domain-containing protein [Betaproteobacteria bacterium]